MQCNGSYTNSPKLVATLSGKDGSIKTQLIENHKSHIDGRCDNSEEQVTLGIITWTEDPDDGTRIPLGGMELSLEEAHELELYISDYFIYMMKKDPEGFAHLMAGDTNQKQG